MRQRSLCVYTQGPPWLTNPIPSSPIVAFGSNTVAVVLVLLNLNPIMNVIACVPAAAVSATVACRAFVRLSTYSHQTYVHNTTGRSRAPSHSNSKVASKERTVGLRSEPFAVGGRDQGGIHVQMDTFVSRVEESRISFGDIESQQEKDAGFANDDSSDHRTMDQKPKSFMP